MNCLAPVIMIRVDTPATRSWVDTPVRSSWYTCNKELSWYSCKKKLSWYTCKKELSWYTCNNELSWYSCKKELSWYSCKKMLSWYSCNKELTDFISTVLTLYFLISRNPRSNNERKWILYLYVWTHQHPALAASCKSMVQCNVALISRHQLVLQINMVWAIIMFVVKDEWVQSRKISV